MFYPFKFKPVYKDYIWGGRNLEHFGRTLPQGVIAESWEISCLPDGLSIISNGECQGKSLYDAIQEYGQKLIGLSLPEKCVKEFPLLVKLIDANQKLSVQVHPGDQYAAANENGGHGKNEAWYIIDAKPGSYVVCDVNPGLDKEKFKNYINLGEIEKQLLRVEVLPGDVIEIPAGRVHSIGEGIVLVEIQQSSNDTYRIYDYNRMDKNGNKRELHVEKALDVIDFGSHERDGTIKGLEVKLNGSNKKTIKIANEHFSLEIYEINGEVKETADGSKFYIYIAIEGQGRINYNGGCLTVSSGETVMIPAQLGSYSIEGGLKLIKTYVPDIEKDIFAVLTESGYTREYIFKNIAGLKYK